MNQHEYKSLGHQSLGHHQMKNYRHEYMLLSRYQQDIEYYYGNGNRYEKHLYFLNFSEHITEMIKLWKKLPVKPTWLTATQLIEYKNRKLGGK